METNQENLEQRTEDINLHDRRSRMSRKDKYGLAYSFLIGLGLMVDGGAYKHDMSLVSMGSGIALGGLLYFSLGNLSESIHYLGNRISYKYSKKDKTNG